MAPICSVVEEARFKARDKRENRTKPQPWIALKLMVVITMAIIVYTGYVYIGRFCVPIILQKASHRYTGRGTGVALLVVFCILYLWLLWAYFKVVATPPGFARDYVSKSPPPVLGPRTHSNVDSWHSPSNSVSDYDPRERHGADPEMTMATSHHQSHPSISSMTHNNHRLDSSNSGTMGGPSYEELSSRFAGTAPMTDTHDTRHPPETEKDLSRSAFPPASVPAEHDQNSHLQNGDPIPVLPTPSPPAVAIPAFFPPQAPASPQPTPSPLKKNPPLRRNSSQRGPQNTTYQPPPGVFVRPPPTTPVLLPEHRYCSRDEFVKPYRAHHCRACGTCVLKYDHHCPWIGQCVGARNHKFFINFNQATAVFTLYTLATLVAYTVISSKTSTIVAGTGPGADWGGGNVDVQTIVVIALAALFFLFTLSLLVSHMRLVWQGQTTVESMQIRSLQDRVKYASPPTVDGGSAGCIVRSNRANLRGFAAEWGSPHTEGNIWWLGSGRKNWEDVMGSNPLGWFLPIGRPLGDGMSYEVNPRFDKEGKWRRRSEWPKEVR